MDCVVEYSVVILIQRNLCVHRPIFVSDPRLQRGSGARRLENDVAHTVAPADGAVSAVSAEYMLAQRREQVTAGNKRTPNACRSRR